MSSLFRKENAQQIEMFGEGEPLQNEFAEKKNLILFSYLLLLKDGMCSGRSRERGTCGSERRNSSGL